MKYNSEREMLKLSEYGRYVQEMAEGLSAIEDRDERNKFAHRIIDVMRRMQYFRSGEVNEQTLWDHLAYITDYTLDIDYPCEIVRREEVHPKKIAYPTHRVKRRHYGNILARAIARVEELEASEQKDYFEQNLKNKMRKDLSKWRHSDISTKKLDEDYDSQK